MRLYCALLLVQLLPNCYREVSSEERLERETDSSPRAPINASELSKISCADVGDELAKTRNADRDETARLVSFIELFTSVKDKTHALEQAMARDPDIKYQNEKSIVNAHEICVQQQADVRIEFETFVRELVQVPIVEEVKGGKTVPAARLDFNTLRRAIDALEPSDKESLLVKVASAEKKIENAPEGGSTGTGRRKGKR